MTKKFALFLLTFSIACFAAGYSFAPRPHDEPGAVAVAQALWLLTNHIPPTVPLKDAKDAMVAHCELSGTDRLEECNRAVADLVRRNDAITALIKQTTQAESAGDEAAANKIWTEVAAEIAEYQEKWDDLYRDFPVFGATRRNDGQHI